MSSAKPDLVNQPTAKPSRKIAAAALASFVTAGVQSYFGGLASSSGALAWLAEAPAMSAVPILVDYAIVAAVGLVTGYMVKERAS